jgi:hypothetical protein
MVYPPFGRPAILRPMQRTAVYITRPGRYEYTDPGAPPEQIDVVVDAGELCARFPEDDGRFELVPIKDMAGTFSQADEQ